MPTSDLSPEPTGLGTPPRKPQPRELYPYCRYPRRTKAHSASPTAWRDRDMVVAAVSDYFRLSPTQVLRGSDRKHRSALARLVTYWILFKDFKLTPVRIARFMNRHHSTVMYAVVEIKDRPEIILIADHIRRGIGEQS